MTVENREGRGTVIDATEQRERLRTNLDDLARRHELRSVKMDIADRCMTTVRADCRCGAVDVILWREYMMPRFKTVYDEKYGSQQVADGHYVQIDDVLPVLRTGVIAWRPDNRCGVCGTRADLVDEFDPAASADLVMGRSRR